MSWKLLAKVESGGHATSAAMSALPWVFRHGNQLFAWSGGKEIDWRFDLPEDALLHFLFRDAGDLVIAVDDTLFDNRQCAIYGIGRADGEVRWRTPLDFSMDQVAGIGVAGGVVAAGGFGKGPIFRIARLDAATGEILER